jgi:peptide/nickel transport system ATP-binding protein
MQTIGEPPSMPGADATVPALALHDLRVWGQAGGRDSTIVSGLTLEVAAGETVAIVGESGSGKSMTAKAAVGLLPPGVHAAGVVTSGGRNLLESSDRELRSIRGTQVGLILQDPFTMLNPLRRCGTQITEMLRDERGRRLGRRARDAEARRRLTEVGIDDPRVARQYPFELSGGMRQRVAIAAALARDPETLIADEPSTALDVTTQKEVLTLLRSLQHSRRMALILITHDLRVAFAAASRTYVMYAGSVLEQGPAGAVEAEPLHPYTLGLLLSEPPIDRRLAAMPGIPGSVPRPDEVAGRCPFADRCEWAAPKCNEGTPALTEVEAGRHSACVRIGEIRAQMAARRAHLPVLHTAADRADPSAIVRVERVSKVFGSLTALDDVSIEIGAGESVGLVGESGSGKSTLARALVNLETITAGRMVVDGIELTPERLGTEARTRLTRTAQIVFQDPYSSLNPVRTVGATLREAVEVVSGRSRGSAAAVAALLEQVGLPAAYAQRKPAALSGGERQRVAIARALAAQPKLLVCDEPVSALDVSVQAQVLNLLGKLRAELGMSYLFITHDLAVVRQVAERVYVLHRGVVVESGRAEDILQRPQHPYTARLVASIPDSHRHWLG